MDILYARKSDLDEIMAIEEGSFTDPWSRAGVEAYLEDPYGGILVAREDGRVLGYAIFHVSFEESELYCVAVRGDCRRRGTGRALLDGILEEVRRRGAQRLFLEVRKSNEPAKALYRAAGFRVLGERKDYYDAPREDAILMERDV